MIFLEQKAVQKRLPDKNCKHDRYNSHDKILKLCRHVSPAALILPPQRMHTHICTFIHSHIQTPMHLHTPRWNLFSFVKPRGDLYRAEKRVRWHFGALELGGSFERKYIQLCLWNVLARMCKDFELSPHLCSCWTLVAEPCAFQFIWQHAASIFLTTKVRAWVSGQATNEPECGNLCWHK